VQAFDVDRRRIGTVRNSVEIQDIDSLEQSIKAKNVDIVILAVPAHAAQPIVDRLVRCGITAILNFVPQRLIVPKGVKVHYVDLAIEIESLSYYLR
jgi:redox-sensing transcriptional repressor